MNLNLKGLPESLKDRAKRVAGEIIVDGINDNLDAHRSPVKGGAFQKKKADGTLSSLFQDGDLRSQITFSEQDTDSIAVGIFEDAPTKEKLKSFNHNTGDTLPQRRFIPSANQKFKKPIMDKVNAAIKEIKKEEDEVQALVAQILDEI